MWQVNRTTSLPSCGVLLAVGEVTCTYTRVCVSSGHLFRLGHVQGRLHSGHQGRNKAGVRLAGWVEADLLYLWVGRPLREAHAARCEGDPWRGGHGVENQM